MVELQLSKLNVAGSTPVSRSASKIDRKKDASKHGFATPVVNRAHIAQLVERVLGKDEVTSSNLVVGSTYSKFTDSSLS